MLTFLGYHNSYDLTIKNVAVVQQAHFMTNFNCGGGSIEYRASSYCRWIEFIAKCIVIISGIHRISIIVSRDDSIGYGGLAIFLQKYSFLLLISTDKVIQRDSIAVRP